MKAKAGSNCAGKMSERFIRGEKAGLLTKAVCFAMKALALKSTNAPPMMASKVTLT